MGKHRFVGMAWSAAILPISSSWSRWCLSRGVVCDPQQNNEKESISSHGDFRTDAVVRVKSYLGGFLSHSFIPVGGLFPLVMGASDNRVGILESATPYWFGRSGKGRWESPTQKYPQFARLVGLGERNGFAISFMVKFIGKNKFPRNH